MARGKHIIIRKNPVPEEHVLTVEKMIRKGQDNVKILRELRKKGIGLNSAIITEIRKMNRTPQENNLEKFERLFEKKGIGLRLSELMQDKELKEAIEELSKEMTDEIAEELQEKTGLQKKDAKFIYENLGKVFVFELLKREIMRLNKTHWEFVNEKDINNIQRLFEKSYISHLNPDIIANFCIFEAKQQEFRQIDIREIITALRQVNADTKKRFENPNLINNIKTCIENKIPVAQIPGILFFTSRKTQDKKYREKAIRDILKSMNREYSELNSKQRNSVINAIVAGVENEVPDFSNFGILFNKINEKEKQTLRVIKQNQNSKRLPVVKKEEQPKPGRIFIPMLTEKPKESDTKRTKKPEVLTYNQKIRNYFSQITNPDIKKKVLFVLNRLNIAIDKGKLKIPEEHIFNRLQKAYPNPNSLQRDGYREIAEKLKVPSMLFEIEKKEESISDILNRVSKREEYKPEDFPIIKKWIQSRNQSSQRYEKLSEMEREALEIIVLTKITKGGATRRIPQSLIQKYLPPNYKKFITELIKTLFDKNLIQFPTDKEQEKTGRNRTYYVINPNLLPFFQKTRKS